MANAINFPVGPGAPGAPGPSQRSARQIRGPQSALTDFLASHNIDANQIRIDADIRRAAARASRRAEDNDNEDSSHEALSVAPTRRNESKVQAKKRKMEEERAITKIKASKSFKRRHLNVSDVDDDIDYDEAARAFYEENLAPIPGQMENCEICEKRFSVTGYTRAGPDRGLLCPKCSKSLDREESALKRKKRQITGATRRKNASNILDGVYPGGKNLVTLCVETLANNVHEAESLGDLPLDLVKKLGAILCKRRLVTSPILDLFLEAKHDTLTLTDAARLNSDDFTRIFQLKPTIKHLKLRNAVQFKDKVMDNLLGTKVELVTFDIHGANLIDDLRWERFIKEKGSYLKALKVHFTDGHFCDDTVQLLPQFCPDLERLKISHNAKVTDKSLEHIALLSKLQYLSIGLYRPIGTKPLLSTPLLTILNSIGSYLRTFSLEVVSKIDNSVLTAIHNNCQKLSKLRITGNETLTDQGFAELFTNWSNPPLSYIDFSECRHIDSADPRQNVASIGLCSSGFKAIMSHSGLKLKYLDVSSCRHISAESFESTFSDGKNYPALEHINISFCQAVNDFIVSSIFRTCPNLKVLIVFGCFGVRDIRVPKGKILTGMPNALGMQIEGTENGQGRII